MNNEIFIFFNQKLINLIYYDFIILLFFSHTLVYVFWYAGIRKIAWDNGIPNIDRFAGFLAAGGDDNLDFILPHFFGWLAVLTAKAGALFF